jgi:serine/threonine-protein kinase
MGESQGLVLQVGRYGLFGPMAAGGMAEVHYGRMAAEGGFQKTIAIKRLLPHVAQNPECRTMIYEEARLAARIRHPNVVQPLDVITTDDEVLLAMEYVHGEALSKLIMRARKRGENVPPSVGMAIVCEMLQGLHAAHEAKDEQGVPLGIVHRDISPQNVIVGADGIARVIDFGIAKATTSSDFTAVGHVKGKLPYLAPEQFGGAPATRSSDIYAAGCVAWELLVGRRLFEGDSDQAVAARILRAPVDPPSAFVEGVPPELDQIILRCVDREPQNRFATARDMALELERVMPLARATLVGEWVEHLAGPELAKRAQRIAEIERSRFEYTPPPVSRKTMPSKDGSPVSRRSLPGLDAPESAPPPSRRPPPSSRAPQSYAPQFYVPQPYAPQSYAPQPPAPPPEPPPPSLRPPTWKAELKPPKAGELQKPELEIPNVNWLPPQHGDFKSITVHKPRKIGGTAFAVVVLLLGVAGFLFALPTIVRRGYEKSAAAQGIALVIGQTEVTQHHVKLLDVQVSMPELPWITAKANAVDVELSGLDAQSITVRGLDITVQGALADLERDLTRWRAVHNTISVDSDATKRRPKFSVESARITWLGALGKATTVSADNVTLDAYGEQDTTKASSPIVTITSTSGAHAGPLRVDYERTPLATRIWFRFDPTGAKTTSAVLTLDPTGPATLDITVPRTRAEELWIPSSYGVSFLSFTIQARLYPGGKSDGRVDAVVSTREGQDLHYNAVLAPTEPGGPLAVTQGTADFSGQRLKPGGTLLFGPAGLDLDLFANCEANRDTQVFAAALDTKDVSESARISVAKDARCTKGGSR